MRTARSEIRIDPFALRGADDRLVRRRGVGHPDALCDALAQTVALALARYSHEHFGEVLPHAVTQATILPGEATPRFGGGAVHAPMQLHLSGHTVHRWHAVRVPVEEIATQAVRCWLRDHLHGVDADRHVRIQCHFREATPGPPGHAHPRLATEPVWGDGHAPLRPLETLVLRAERAIACASTRTSDPAAGEDLEVVAIRDESGLQVHAWCCFVDSHLDGAADLAAVRARVGELMHAALGDQTARVTVNDGAEHAGCAEEVTVTGTRAEALRGGTSGRSQGVNGVLAVDGPATELGIAGTDMARDPRRLCQLGAELLSNALLRANPELTAVRCRLLALPGDRLFEDLRVSLGLALPDARIPTSLRAGAQALAVEHLAWLPHLWRELCGSAISIDGWPLDRLEPDPLRPGGLYGDALAGMLRSIEAGARETGARTGRPVLDRRVLAALARVPRHRFVPSERRDDAYRDRPLPIGEGQTISQPFIVALMTDLAGIDANARVLEIGTGSGYQTAVLAELAAEVCSIERIGELHERARRLLAGLGYRNVKLVHGDGREGWEGAERFDAVLVTAATDRIPPRLLAALRPGGRLVAPIGPPGEQILTVATRHADGTTSSNPLLPVAFVPLL